MWPKSSEAKATAASHTPAPAHTKPEEKPQAGSQASPSSTAAAQSASPTATTTAKAPETPAAVTTAAAVSTKTTTPAAAAPVRDPVAPNGPSTISAGLKIKGEITGTSDLTVDGETQGKIRLTNGRVTVGPKGRVNDIDAREIVVLGTVQGNLKASESVRLGPSSHVEGSVLTPRISIDDGARLRGNVEMVRAGETATTDKAEETKTPAAARVASASTGED
jgi:cytoskeletal protein CcmA (bactofilin family)